MTADVPPVIYGSFTEWKPRRMMTLFDFLQLKEPEENKLDDRNLFEQLKRKDGFG